MGRRPSTLIRCPQMDDTDEPPLTIFVFFVAAIMMLLATLISLMAGDCLPCRRCTNLECQTTRTIIFEDNFELCKIDYGTVYHGKVERDSFNTSFKACERGNTTEACFTYPYQDSVDLFLGYTEPTLRGNCPILFWWYVVWASIFGAVVFYEIHGVSLVCTLVYCFTLWPCVWLHHTMTESRHTAVVISTPGETGEICYASAPPPYHEEGYQEEVP